ncbi:MAG: HAD-IC family P-type ATPase, partial [Nitrospiraceae bacterium]|nr:HAD-IC family P-type ATPase [Nitrospiraceae bacterium]
MVQAIHASVKGRVRYKIKGLYRSESLKKHLESNFSGRDGISYFSANTLTGNVLVCFNSHNTPHAIASLIEGIAIEYSNEKTTRNDSAKKSIISRRKLRKSVIHAEDQTVKTWHLMESATVVGLMETSKHRGLSDERAKERLKKFGPNVLPESVPRSGLSIFIDQFKSLPVALLGVAAGISIVTGGLADAVVILGVVTINAAIGYTTESQAEKTIHSLKSLVRPSALVIRDGNIKEIGAEQVVPGDILVLRPGSYVAADARLMEANHLSIDESTLTGESMPVLKRVESLELRVSADVPLADRVNMVYMGTLVTGGQGLAVVVATGRFTEIGKIQTLVGEAKPPETPMERQLSRMGTQLVIIGGAVCGVVFVIGLLRGYGLLQMLKTSISLAVAAVPEGLPTVATTTLALGIRKMRRHNVLIRHLDAVETLGSVQTICLDKTGTITMNRMSVVFIYTGMRRIMVSGGNFSLENKDDRRQLLHDRKSCVNPYQCDELLRLIHVSVLCNESEVTRQNDRHV